MDKTPVLLSLLLTVSRVTVVVGQDQSLPRASLVDNVWAFLKDTFSFIFQPIVKSASSTIYGRTASSDRQSYKNYQLLRVFPRTTAELEELEGLEDEGGVLFWSRPAANRSLDLMVSPGILDDFKQYLVDAELDFKVLSSNVQKLINEQNPKSDKKDIVELKSTKGHLMTWTRYHRYSDMLNYLEYLQNTYPSLVEIFTIGKSFEGKPLKVVKISSSVAREQSKPAVWIDGGTHGREWISPAVALYFIKQLVENYGRNRNIVDPLDWYILPVMNPDGYEYSHTKDRFWRKSRSFTQTDYDSSRRGRFFWENENNCRGVDLNRNWDFHWGEKGASEDPCKETYPGSRAFSEPETRAIADFIMDHKERLSLYLTLHSYSQMWLIPWSYTRSKVKDYDDLVFMGRKAVEALKKVHGTEYEIGTSTALLYPTSGCSDDWAKGKAGIKYTYTVELRDRGSYGFLLPASQITPTGRETFAAVRSIAKAIIKEYG